MRVNRAYQLFDRALEAQRERRFGNQLCRTRTDHVHAEDLVVFLVEDDLDEAFDFAGNPRARQDAELEAAGLDLVPAGLRFFLRQADAANFGIAVCAARYLVVVDRAELLTRDSLGQRDALRRREVRELRMAGLLERDDISDRRDPG